MPVLEVSPPIANCFRKNLSLPMFVRVTQAPVVEMVIAECFLDPDIANTRVSGTHFIPSSGQRIHYL
jgi:hypothetical protein